MAPRRTLTRSLIVSLALSPSLAGLAMAEESGGLLTPPEITEDAIALLGESIAFRTVDGAENQTEAYAKFLAKRLTDGGFSKSDVIVEKQGTTATLVAYYRGSGEKKPVLLSAHMDVVDAHPEDWERSPFAMAREEGYLFGRGTSDNKFGVVMLVSTLIRLKSEGFAPSRDIILVLSGDEETHMDTTQVLADKFKDAEIVLNSDGGGGALGEDGSPLAYYLQGAEKTYADFEITFTNEGGHSSAPRADNAIYDLAKAALMISAYKFPVQTSEITLEFFRQVGARTEGDLGKAMLAFAKNPSDKKAIKTISARPEYVGQLGTTCIATMLDAGHAQNALPQRAMANVNCRIFPGVDPEDVRAKLVEIIDDPKAEVKLSEEVNSSDASPLRDDVVAAVRKAVDRRYPDLPIVPQMSAGASDSLHFRARGVDSYGVSGIFMKASDEFAHGLNERIPEATVDGALDHWHTLLTEIAG